MRAEILAVQPEDGVHGDALEAEKDALCNLLFVDGEVLEIVGGVLRKRHLVEKLFPDARHLDFLRAARICRIPAVDDARVFCVEQNIPVAVQAHDRVHSRSFDSKHEIFFER